MKQKTVFALVDCNAFFCSCEILFRPELREKPVGVLSNNDGCFVSLTKEFKALGVEMGAPYFKVKKICDENKVGVFSSNFALYTNISDRVMDTLAALCSDLEVYSVDEAFLNLSGFESKGLTEHARKIKKTVEQNTGIPVSIGIGATKTLAKAANHLAKRSTTANGVVNLMSSAHCDFGLAKVPVKNIWGIGGRSVTKLNSLGVYNAKQLRDFPNEALIQKIFTKVGLQRKQELQGLCRFPIEKNTHKKKTIMCSRTFAKATHSFSLIEQAIANYTSSACEKLRAQNSICHEVEVFARTSLFNQNNSYYGSQVSKLSKGTNDTREIAKVAINTLKKIYRNNQAYRKVGVRLLDIRDREKTQLNLFDSYDYEKSEKIMHAMDQINAKEGSGTVRIASCGVNSISWAMNRNFKSPRYVTGWSELRKVK